METLVVVADYLVFKPLELEYEYWDYLLGILVLIILGCVLSGLSAWWLFGYVLLLSWPPAVTVVLAYAFAKAGL